MAENIKINKNLHGESFNFGPNNKINHNVEDLVKKIRLFWKNIKFLIKPDKSKFESNLLKINSNKAKKKLNWKCILTFAETAKYISKWYINYFGKQIKLRKEMFGSLTFKTSSFLFLRKINQINFPNILKFEHENKIQILLREYNFILEFKKIK